VDYCTWYKPVVQYVDWVDYVALRAVTYQNLEVYASPHQGPEPFMRTVGLLEGLDDDLGYTLGV
jgi:hypothetical protein